MRSKYNQLQISFGEQPAIIQINTDNVEKTPKIYAPREMGQHPFFLIDKTNACKKSRRGYEALKQQATLEKQGVDKETIIKKTTYQYNPTDSFYTTSKNWTIVSNPKFGLPDSFDGLVWSYIELLISDIYKKSGKFYYFYYVDPSDIVNYLIDKGLYKKSGKLYNNVRDSIYRLRYTSYEYAEGFYNKKEEKPLSKYTLSLIQSIHEQGSTLPDGSVATSFAIAIDPLIIQNYSTNYYLILLSDYRSKIKSHPAIALFNRLSYLAFNGIISRDFTIAKKFKFPFIIVNGYENLCEFLGLTPLSENDCRPSNIIRQLKSFIDELIEINCLYEIHVDKSNSSTNIIFCLSGDFIDDATGLLSKAAGNELQFMPTMAECKKYFAKMKKFIHSDKLRKALFNPEHVD